MIELRDAIDDVTRTDAGRFAEAISARDMEEAEALEQEPGVRLALHAEEVAAAACVERQGGRVEIQLDLPDGLTLASSDVRRLVYEIAYRLDPSARVEMAGLRTPAICWEES